MFELLASQLNQIPCQLLGWPVYQDFPHICNLGIVFPPLSDHLHPGLVLEADWLLMSWSDDLPA